MKEEEPKTTNKDPAPPGVARVVAVVLDDPARDWKARELAAQANLQSPPFLGFRLSTPVFRINAKNTKAGCIFPDNDPTNDERINCTLFDFTT